MSKQAIIDTIIADGAQRAENALADARKRAEAIAEQAQNECGILRENNAREAQIAVEEIARRSETVAELDAKKLVLKAKSDILDNVYSVALDKLKKLDAKTYEALIWGMLENAEDGDTVTVSKRESKIVTKKKLGDFAAKRGITLNFGGVSEEFDGGVMLSGGGVDKNLTLDVEIALVRDETEARIAHALFD